MRNQALVDQFRARGPQLSVGVLTADWMTLGLQVQLLERAGIGMLHFDVMDGCFSPMLTLGAPVVAGLRTPLLKDVHLMIEEPLNKIESFVAAGADIVTVHAESTRHLHRALQALGTMTNTNDSQRGIVRGVALNPGTPLAVIDPLFNEIEMVLLLAVNPGWSGQTFVASTWERLQDLRARVRDKVLICVDGGITRENVAEVAHKGADIIVTGSAVFDGRSPFENAQSMIGALQ